MISEEHKRSIADVSALFLVALLSILYISLTASPAQAAEIVIPAISSDSDVCTIIEREHSRGLDLWRAKNLAGALDCFKASEDVLKKRALWMPPKLAENPSEIQRRALRITNSVIFSLAALHQKMGRRVESERYADMARERGLLPKIFMSGSKPR